MTVRVGTALRAALPGAHAHASARPRLHHWAAALLLLAFISGDGVATALQAQRGLTSPYLVLVPLLLMGVLLLIFDAERLSIRMLLWVAGLGAFAAALLLLQMNLFYSFNLDGYAQLWVIFLCFFVVQELVADASDPQVAALRSIIRLLHYGVAGYLVVTTAVWHAWGYDLSVPNLILRVPQRVNEYYGFRPAGLNREPAWAGFLLASTFFAVYFMYPQERLRALIAMVVGIAALRSGTAFAFAGVAVAVVIVQRQRGLPLGRTLLLSLIAFVALIGLFGQRVGAVLEGADPSGLMRVRSAGVAAEVIDDSFPLGVGYGNFREHAEYGNEFQNYIDLVAVAEYKSDIAFLNLISEFGVAGLVIVGALAILYARGEHLLLWVHFASVMVLAGGLLIPSNMLMVIVIGYRERERRRSRTVEVSRLLPVRARRRRRPAPVT